MDAGGDNGNGHRLPFDAAGASIEEAARDAVDVLRRLDNHGEALVAMAGDVAAVRREQTTIRADVHRCVDSVTAQALLLDGMAKKLGILEAIEKKLGAIAKHMGVAP